MEAPLPLTDTKARNAKPKERPYKLFDGDGLFLNVTPSGGNRNKDQILSWLPATHKECCRVIQEATRSDNWTDTGVIAEIADIAKCSGTSCKAFDATMTIENSTHRAIVIHSSAHDKRKHQRIDSKLNKNKEALEQMVKKITAEKYFCKVDAEAAAVKPRRIPKKSDCYPIETAINWDNSQDTMKGRTSRGQGSPMNPHATLKPTGEVPMLPTVDPPEPNEYLLKWILCRPNLQKACKRVQTNAGAPGVDGVTVDKFPWLRRRVRMCYWKQWRYARKRSYIGRWGGDMRSSRPHANYKF